ncbi:GNAT family N-acetyltransferase [uncultured Cohaesibacter sp.]|uniref:GNAT family N-acetyltransferase n=1 Tax=uncultured Cohaesibacter sp. TaxID=1002546 RepID=UPI0029C88423|nr:GNAT family N-acetyltransferase [uncultured Cohaesibacter sp.]
MQIPSLESERLLLRPLQHEDAEFMETMCGDFAVSKYLERVPYPYPKGGAQTFIDRQAKGFDGITYAISGEESFMGMLNIRASTERAVGAFAPSIGYWLGEAFWGKGYMQEAIARLLNWYMPLEPTERIRSSVFEDNPRSLNLLSKLGFTEVGRGRSYSLARGAEVIDIELELTADRYYGSA